jgi:hypothetical protein
VADQAVAAVSEATRVGADHQNGDLVFCGRLIDG